MADPPPLCPLTGSHNADLEGGGLLGQHQEGLPLPLRPQPPGAPAVTPLIPCAALLRLRVTVRTQGRKKGTWNIKKANPYCGVQKKLKYIWVVYARRHQTVKLVRIETTQTCLS